MSQYCRCFMCNVRMTLKKSQHMPKSGHGHVATHRLSTRSIDTKKKVFGHYIDYARIFVQIGNTHTCEELIAPGRASLLLRSIRPLHARRTSLAIGRSTRPDRDARLPQSSARFACLFQQISSSTPVERVASSFRKEISRQTGKSCSSCTFVARFCP